MTKTIIVLLGPPGSGKGTQSKLLAEKLSLPHIGIGTIIRSEAINGSESAKNIKSLMEEGMLVPDDMVFSIISDQIAKEEYKTGFIFDGFPRTLAQAKVFEDMLSSINQALTKVFYLEAPQEKLIERLMHRITCDHCGNVFNLKSNPPESEGVCNDCQNQLSHRGDDEEKRIAYRVSRYIEQTAPLVEYYESQNIIKRIVATGDISAIHNELLLEFNS